MLALAGCGGSEAARVTAPPASVNEPPEVRITGLDAGQAVELHAAWKSDIDGARWTSALELQANGDGTARGPDRDAAAGRRGDGFLPGPRP